MKQAKAFYKTVYIQLKEFLLNTDIYPGQKVPHVEIGSKLGISLTPLREAFFRLAAEGLLAHEENRGFFLPEISLVEAKELYEVRGLIEPYMAEKAAKSVTERQLMLLHKILDDYKQRASEPYSRSRLQVDREFHVTIMQLAHNKRLAQIVNQVYDQLIIRRKLEHLSPERPFIAYQEHVEIYRALEKKDPKRAGQLMRAHIESAKRFVLGDMERRQKEFPARLTAIKELSSHK
jgi:DNA-binding GntR family transcriptional regulator